MQSFSVCSVVFLHAGSAARSAFLSILCILWFPSHMQSFLWSHFFYHGVTKALDTGCGVVVHFRFIADFEFRFIADFLDKSQRREE